MFRGGEKEGNQICIMDLISNITIELRIKDIQSVLVKVKRYPILEYTAYKHGGNHWMTFLYWDSSLSRRIYMLFPKAGRLGYAFNEYAYKEVLLTGFDDL